MMAGSLPNEDRETAAASTVWMVGLLLVIGTALRFALLTHQSFWYDECVSVKLARAPVWDIAAGRARDLGNPPLYLLLLHVWMQVFGSSDAAVRALSGVAGAASIPLVFAIGRRLVGTRVGLLAAAIFCLSPVQIYFAQEARAYAVVTFLCLVSTLALLRALRAPEQLRWWALFSATTFLAMYTHYFAAFVVVAQVGWLVTVHGGERRIMVRCLAAMAAAGLCFAAAWLPSLMAQATTKGNLGRAEGSWHLHVLATPMVFGVGTTLLWKGLATTPRVVAGALALLAFGGLAMVGAWSLRRSRAALLLLLVWLAAPVLVPALVSVLLFPFYYSRYALMAAPAYYILIAAGLLNLRAGARVLVVTVLILTSTLSLGTYFTTLVKHDWRAAAAWTLANVQDGDLLAFDADIGETAFAHYAGSDRRRVRLLQPPDDRPESHYWGTSSGLEPSHAVGPTMMAARRVWVAWSDPQSGTGDYYRGLFEREWRRVDGRIFRGIDVGIFERRR
jgi:mannosyltransferase